MRTRRLIVTLPSETYRVLSAVARRDDRAVDQQASVLLKRALAAAPEADTPQSSEQLRKEAR
jgi:hypothetical protein